MTCKCGCGSLIAHSTHPNLRADPTRTTMTRKRFVADINRRFGKLIKAIEHAVVELDVLGLRTPPRSIDELFAHLEPRAFDFPRSADKVTAFIAWLAEEQNKHLFSVVHKPGRLGAAVESAWTDIYIESAYKQGIRRAGQEMKNIGISIPIPVGELGVDPVILAFQSPVHADRVGLLYTRTYSELAGITAAMDQQISRILAEGMIDGRNPEVLARRIVDRVEKIGRTRARMLARTELVRAHHKANIQEYRNAGLLGVSIQAEWLTAGFDVCPECLEISKRDVGHGAGIFSLDEVEDMIPVHPNCRCVALPYSDKWKDFDKLNDDPPSI